MTHFKWLALVACGLVAFASSTWAAEEAAKPAAGEAEEAAKPAAGEKEPGLVACWKFDEGEGTAAKDSAGENNGKIVNAKWVDGKVGKALEFNGQDSLVDIPNAAALNLTKAITIEVWVKHRGDYITTWEAILAKGDSAYRLHLDEYDQSFGLGLNGGAGDYWNQASEVKPDPDKWYFVVATFDGKKSCLYVDGKLANSSEDCPSEIATNDYGINIGENNEMPGRGFNGVIDEVKIYDRALSAEDVAKHFQAASKEPGLIAYWKFDEGEGTAAKDSAGKNNGKVLNAKWVDGKVGKALDFNGQDSLVDIPNAPALNLTKAITIEAWVKHRGEPTVSWEAILAKGDTAYRLHLDETDLSFGLGLNGAMGDFWNQASGVKPDADKWYFVVATFDGKKSCLYVDGKLANSTEDCPSEITTNDYGINIGENNEASGRVFSGTIDEVKIYDRALTAEEVTEHFKRVK